MRVGWLHDDPGYVGGAELTMRELAAAAPESLVAVEEADTVVVGNCWLIDPGLVEGKRVIRFIHDHRGPGPIDSDHRIFYSPLQRRKVGLDGELCPAPLDRERFKPSGGEGAIHIGTFGHPGKGQHLLRRWSDQNGLLVVYGHGPLVPLGPKIDYRGGLRPEEVPDVLRQFGTFVHLPTEVEAYGRGVVEAWAAGLNLVVNHNVGALYWLEEEPDAIDHAAERFWDIVKGFSP